jgi:hypothetical protein
MKKTLMPDTPLPFRPRISSPVDRALSNIEAQATAVRRRVNRFALERAVFLIGGASLVGFSLLVAFAFLLSRQGYALVTWLILASLGFVVWSGVRRLRRVWLSRVAAPVIIDHRVALEDRLATLVAASAKVRQSRLWDFLLHENLRLLPRWEPRRLEPRAMPRSVWFFALSVLLALFALWMTPRRGVFGGAARSEVGLGQREPQAGEDEQTAEEAPDLAPGSSLWSDLPESLRQAILGSRASRNFAGAIPEKTLPLDEERGGPAIAGNRMASHGPVRSAPASPDAARLAGHEGSTMRGAPAPNAARPPAGQGEPTTSSRPARGEAPKELGRVESGRAKIQARAPQAKGGASGNGGAGAGSGGDQDGLYGERQAPGQTAGSFALDLDAMRSVQPAKEGESDSPSAPPSSRLADEQRLDDAIRRAQVPVEYEKIVQRIFARVTESSDRPDRQE